MLMELAVSHVSQVRATVFDALDGQDVADLERVGRKILHGMDSAHWMLSDGDTPAEAAVTGGATGSTIGGTTSVPDHQVNGTGT